MKMIDLRKLNYVHWLNNFRPHSSLNYHTPAAFNTCPTNNCIIKG